MYKSKEILEVPGNLTASVTGKQYLVTEVGSPLHPNLSSLRMPGHTSEAQKPAMWALQVWPWGPVLGPAYPSEGFLHACKLLQLSQEPYCCRVGLTVYSGLESHLALWDQDQYYTAFSLKKKFYLKSILKTTGTIYFSKMVILLSQ